MNANELADLLADSNDPDIRRAVAMLRQQQAEIDALKKSLTEAQQESLNWEERYRSFKMNNKPVAWMSNESFEVSTLNIGRFDIPLYTHPVKEQLTDEEIYDAYEEYCKTDVSEKGCLQDFARAILRKAQEK